MSETPISFKMKSHLIQPILVFYDFQGFWTLSKVEFTYLKTIPIINTINFAIQIIDFYLPISIIIST
jgi:hypothetical protein